MMILTDGTEVSRETARHKFGGDPFAEYLYVLSLEGMLDSSGDCEAPCGWFALIGRHLLREDSQGYVWRQTYTSEAGARVDFDLYSDQFAEWLDSEDDDGPGVGPVDVGYGPNGWV